jgi:PilZ domain
MMTDHELLATTVTSHGSHRKESCCFYPVLAASYGLISEVMADARADLGHYQRRWQRLHTNLPVRILVKTPDCVRIVDARGTQLNEGGVAVYAGVELEIGDRVNVELTMPDSQAPLRLTAVVRNRTGYLYGLQFQSASAEVW